MLQTKLGDIHDIEKDKWGQECLTCTSKKFLFPTVEDKEIKRIALIQTSIANVTQFQILI